MKTYEKPFLSVITVSDNDIIQTSGLVVDGPGSSEDDRWEWPTTTSVDAAALAVKK